MYNLQKFTYRELMECRAALRDIFANEPITVEEGSQRIVQFLYDNFRDAEGRPACALVRMFKTHPYEYLDEELKSFARGIVPEADTIDRLRCLVLLSTAGQEPAWNSRHASRGHKCIPLVSEKMVEEAPMISQLIKQIGLTIASVIRPDPGLMLDATTRNYNVFYVPQAEGSPYIVAQEEFVRRYRIASVIGFGGLAGAGDLLATIMFTNVPIPTDVADLFGVIGLNSRIAMLPLLRKPLFDERRGRRDEG